MPCLWGKGGYSDEQAVLLDEAERELYDERHGGLFDVAAERSGVCGVVSNALRLRFFNNRSILNFCVDNKQNLEVKMKKEIIIEGMACEHCSRNVENALRNIDEISDVNVNLKEKKAIIVLTKDIQDNKLFEVIKKAGYTPVRVKKITS